MRLFIITAWTWADMRLLAATVLILAISPAAAATDPGAPLAAFDFGAYAELVARPNPGGHAIVFIPSLVSVLLAAERSRGGPLGEAEVLSFRDRSGAMAVPADNARRLEEGRGYRDLDPDRCWQDWQAQRLELVKPEGNPDALP
jgi:hypothetical protein